MTIVEERLSDEKLAQLAEMRAAAAEGEPEVNPETGGELEQPETTEPERQQVPAPTVTDPERLERSLNSEQTRHENALKKAYGDAFADRAFCPACLGEGFLKPWPAGEMPDEVWEALTALCGRAQDTDFQTPDDYVVCHRCQGIGRVATGARNEHNAVIECSECQSRGYFDTRDPIHRAKLGLAPPAPPEPVQPFQSYGFMPPAVTVAPSETAPEGWIAGGKLGADTWGRWPGHSRFGIDPAMNGGVW